MTDKQKATESAWLEYYGKGTPEEPPMMPPAFRRGFEDGAKWERERCCRIVTGLWFLDNESTKIVHEIEKGDNQEIKPETSEKIKALRERWK